jgi:hypothetical protein
MTGRPPSGRPLTAHHPGAAIEAMIHVAKVVANAEARHSGKSYLVGSTLQPDPALYAFAANHPDARDAAFNIIFDCPPGSKLVRRSAPQRTRH